MTVTCHGVVSLSSVIFEPRRPDDLFWSSGPTRRKVPHLFSQIGTYMTKEIEVCEGEINITILIPISIDT